MAMSRDRVQFVLKDSSSNKYATAKAAAKAFGMEARDAQRHIEQANAGMLPPVVIVCRPSQFARFLVYRAEGVTNNAFRQFKAKLIPAEGEAQRIDVSKTPHGYDTDEDDLADGFEDENNAS